MDIKIGKVTWDDDASRILKERRKQMWPLREVTGFSILGYMVGNFLDCEQSLFLSFIDLVG